MINLRYPTIATPKIATPSIRLPGGYQLPAQTTGPVIPPGYQAPKQYAPLPNTTQIPGYAPNIKLPPVVNFNNLTPGWGTGAMPAPQFAPPTPLTGMTSLINSWNQIPKTQTPPALNIPVQTAKPAAPKLPAPAVKPMAITKRTK